MSRVLSPARSANQKSSLTELTESGVSSKLLLCGARKAERSSGKPFEYFAVVGYTASGAASLIFHYPDTM
jgi:hypothetical protein